MVVGRVLELARRAAFDGHLDAAFPLVRVPDAVVEAELDFLLDIAGEVVRRHPTGVDVERGLAAVGIGVDHLQLHRVPGRAVGRADEAALARGRDAARSAAERRT